MHVDIKEDDAFDDQVGERTLGVAYSIVHVNEYFNQCDNKRRLSSSAVCQHVD
jgi:hypothetical protein